MFLLAVVMLSFVLVAARWTLSWRLLVYCSLRISPEVQMKLVRFSNLLFIFLGFLCIVMDVSLNVLLFVYFRVCFFAAMSVLPDSPVVALPLASLFATSF